MNEYVELVQRYDAVNAVDNVPDIVKKATLISNTPEPLRTHLQLHAAKLLNFNEARVMVEDYLRSRRMFKTDRANDNKNKEKDDDPMEVDAVWKKKGKGKGKDKGKAKGDKGKGKGKKGKTKDKSQEKSTGKYFEGECRNCHKWGHRAADCWFNEKNVAAAEQNKNQESPAPSTVGPGSSVSQSPNSTRLAGCVEREPDDNKVWILMVEKNGESDDDEKLVLTTGGNFTDVMVDSGCFGHVCTPEFAAHFPVIESEKIKAKSASNHALKHYGARVVQAEVQTTDGEKMNIEIRFEVMDAKRTLISTTSLKRNGVSTTFGEDGDWIAVGNKKIQLKTIGDHSFLRMRIKDEVGSEFLVLTGEIDEEWYEVLDEEALEVPSVRRLVRTV